MSYKRRKFLEAQREQGWTVFREGGGHTIVQSADGKKVPSPRHKEINRDTARKIASETQIDWSEFKKAVS
jgi:predicted RNA binding protein YcfA (HicA-like mRNA interferase family)